MKLDHSACTFIVKNVRTIWTHLSHLAHVLNQDSLWSQVIIKTYARMYAQKPFVLSFRI